MWPFGVMSVQTASKILSATGSSMYCINSFTDTIAFMSPSNGWLDDAPLVGPPGFEHCVTKIADTSSPAAAMTEVRPFNISAPYRIESLLVNVLKLYG